MRSIAIAVSLAAILAAGCRIRSSYIDFYDGQTSGAELTGSFADETYVWESFHLVTNRVERRP